MIFSRTISPTRFKDSTARVNKLMDSFILMVTGISLRFGGGKSLRRQQTFLYYEIVLEGDSPKM
jgi:hypothetical protein